MDDGRVDKDPDLNASVGESLVSTKNDKIDANDSTPTSSTDAASSFPGTSAIVSEDPISSTSSDVMEREKLQPITKPEKSDKDASKNLLGADGDVDLLDMNIANVSSELISEDVEDIVQDLENLLGEPEPQHDFPTRRKEKSPSEEKELLTSLDNPLGEIAESKTCPSTSNSESPKETESVEVLQSNNAEEASLVESPEMTNESSINTSDHSTLEQPTVKEAHDNEEKSKAEKVQPVSEKEETVQDLPDTKIQQNDAAENEVSAVTSSEIINSTEKRDRGGLVVTKEVETHELSDGRGDNAHTVIGQSEVSTNVPSGKTDKEKIDEVSESKDEPVDITDSTECQSVGIGAKTCCAEATESEGKHVDIAESTECQTVEIDDNKRSAEELESKGEHIDIPISTECQSVEIGENASSAEVTEYKEKHADITEFTECQSVEIGDETSSAEVTESRGKHETETECQSVEIDDNRRSAEDPESKGEHIDTISTEGQSVEIVDNKSSAEAAIGGEKATNETCEEKQPDIAVSPEDAIPSNENLEKSQAIILEESSEVIVEEQSTVNETTHVAEEVVQELSGHLADTCTEEVDQSKEVTDNTTPASESSLDQERNNEESKSPACTPNEISEETNEADSKAGKDTIECVASPAPEIPEHIAENEEIVQENNKPDILSTEILPEETITLSSEEINPRKENEDVEPESVAPEIITEAEQPANLQNPEEGENICDIKNTSSHTEEKNSVENLGSPTREIQCKEETDQRQSVEDVPQIRNLAQIVEEGSSNESDVEALKVTSEVEEDDLAPSLEQVTQEETVVLLTDQAAEQTLIQEHVEEISSPTEPVHISETEYEITEVPNSPKDLKITQDSDSPCEIPIETVEEEHTFEEITVVNQQLTENDVEMADSEERNDQKSPIIEFPAEDELMDSAQKTQEFNEVIELPQEVGDSQNFEDNTVSTGIVENPSETSSSIQPLEDVDNIVENPDTVENSDKNETCKMKTEVSHEISCSISEQKVEDHETEDSESSESANKALESLKEDNLVPVEEEICIKKVIVYEHDCHSHETPQNKTSNEDKQELSNVEQTIVDAMEECTDNNSDNLSSPKIEEQPAELSSIDVTISDQHQQLIQSKDVELRKIETPCDVIIEDQESGSIEQKKVECENLVVQDVAISDAIISSQESPVLGVQSQTDQSGDCESERVEPNPGEIIQTAVDSGQQCQETESEDKGEEPPSEVIQSLEDTSVPDEGQLEAELETLSAPSKEDIPAVAASIPDKSASIVDETEGAIEPLCESTSEEAKIDEPKEVILEKLDDHSNQKEEVSSSDQQITEAVAEEIIESEQIITPPNSTIKTDLVIEAPLIEASEEHTKDAGSEHIIEDQTSAAVQSILDNMLTEERQQQKIIQKEETPVVHSSYSSYEVQKAVQEIQCISQNEEVMEMSPEVIESISSSEKHNDFGKTEYCNEVLEARHMGDQIEVIESQVPEEKEAVDSILPQEESLNSIETPVTEVGEKIDAIEEVVGSPISDQQAVTQSSEDENVGGVVENIEDRAPLQSKEESSSGIVQSNEPVVIPSIDLSEESSSEEGSDEEKKQNVVSSSSNVENKVVKNVAKAEKVSSNVLPKSEAKKFSPRETRHSSRISEKVKPLNLREDIEQPLSVNVDDVEEKKPYSPKITIKPIKEDEPSEEKEEHKGSLKITITKQSDNTHSILKMCSPDFEHRQKQSDNDDQNTVPKLIIKTSDTHSDQHSPKISTRSSRQALPANSHTRSGSPRITIKPIVKPETKETITSPLKITIKPIGKPEEFSRQQQKHSPKQSKNKSDEDHYSTRSKMLKSSENSDVHSPKVTIKPVKPPEETEVVSTPKITIKPIEKPEEARVSPKITIKPVVKPTEETEVDDEVKQRIVLKINKGNLPPKDAEKIGRESRKRELEEDKSEKLAKIKLKFSKDGDAHIVHKTETESQSFSKRQHDIETERSKRFKPDTTDSDDDVKLIENTQSPIVISEDSQSQDSVIIIESAKDPLADVPEPKPLATPVSAPRKRGRPRKVPLVVREEFVPEQTETVTPVIINAPSPMLTVEQSPETEGSGRPKRSCRAQSVRDTLGIKPRKPSKPRGGKRGAKSTSSKADKGPGFGDGKVDTAKSLLTEDALQNAHGAGILTISSPAKKEEKKEEPVKPFGLKSLLEAAKDQNIIEVIDLDSPSNSPKRQKLADVEKTEECVVEEVEELGKIDPTDKDTGSTENIAEIKNFDVQKEELDLRDDVECTKEPSEFGGTDAVASDVEMQPPTPVFAPPLNETSVIDINNTTDIAMFEEETRMSADVSSRAQTPAKQVVSADVVVEESQSSIQSTATTESGKISRKSRLEVHQDQDGSVFTADQLNEYYWGGNGPFMIQEQVAQFLGIKSFKRKYPAIPRRMVDMQERDYIRENGLASESMCDLGLTAVNSADILDIMYTDFQEKYEEFCRFQRDKQAKDLLNKQRALSLQATQEKSKLDILEQAVQSAAAYNANFNKTRREQRRACMDLQTMNIHYPKGKLKKISMPKIGDYPVAVVPGQFTDYYKEFSPTELNNLPLNTMLYTELYKILPEVSDSDSDSSGSDSDDSSSSGSDSNSSCEENCKMCEKRSVTPRKSPVNSSV